MKNSFRLLSQFSGKAWPVAGIVLMLTYILLPASGLQAATRLGLHVTQEELDIWRNRTEHGPYREAWTDRILPKADAFKNNPTDGTWSGWTGPGCFPQDQQTGLGGHNYGGLGTTKAVGLLDSAFVYLITGDTSYRDPVRNLLLTQAANPGTDFSNRSLWCIQWTQSTLWIGNWLTKLLFAYDYIRPSLSASDRSQLDTWFHNAAIYWEQVVSNEVMRQKFPNRPDYSQCVGWGCPGNYKGKSHWDGWDVYGFHGGGWSNQPASAMLFAGSVAILLNDLTLQDKLKMWVKEEVMFSMFPDGTIFDQYRWHDKNPPAIASAWSHGLLQLIPVLMLADHFARAGDLELYEFTTTQGMFGTEGGPKSLLKGMQRLAEMANGTIKVYASYDSTLTSDEIITWDTGNGHIEDLAMAQSNMYYQDPEVRAAVNRTPPANPSCGGYNCWSEPWGGVPDTLFMFGQMEGKVWPYPSSPPVTPQVTFSATPGTIPSGQSATLTWSTENGTLCSASGGWTGQKPLNGSEIVLPTLTTDYTLTCTGDSGQATETVTVTVNPSDQEEQVIGDATFVGDSGNLTTLNREPQNLWDGDTTTEDGSTGAAGISSFYVEFDLGQVRHLTRAKLFGDDQGTWVCSSWILEQRSSLQDNWTQALSSSCDGRQWHEGLLSLTARYVRVTVHGTTGGTQAFELEVYALKAATYSVPPQTPKGLRIVE